MHPTTLPTATTRGDHDHDHDHDYTGDAPPIRLLLLDGSVFDAQLLEERLLRDKLRHELVRVETEAQLRAALQLPHDLIISETAVGNFSAGHALAILRELDLDIPLVVLTADIDEATLAGLLRAGAVDYVFKSRLGRLTQALRLAIERARLVRHLHARTRDMARLSLDLIQAQEAERKALARELHDELGQRLSALNLLLHRSLPHFQAGDAHALWRQAETDMASLVELVRNMSVSLRPPDLDYFGLEPTIRQLLTRQFETGPGWVFEYAGLPQRLDPVLEISVFRLVQESVTNIVRHARARQVVVEINGGAAGEELELIVRDDGIGFDPSCWRENGARQRRAGLIGMSERVQLLGGSFDVGSTPRRGTRIAATLPLQSLETRHASDTGR